MIYLYDSTADLTGIVNEYDSAIETERWSEPSELTSRMPSTRFAEVSASRYFSVNERMYLIENIEVSGEGWMTVTGRSAVVELDHRTCGYTKRITGKPWAILNALMAPLTGSRAITPTLGADPNLGTSTKVQITWGHIGERIREVLEAQGLSIVAVRDSGIKLNIIAPEYGGRYIGDRYRNADLQTYTIDESAWKNYAYVAGQGEGLAREVVEVDITGGGERRELYVDADDLSKDDLTTAEYRELLAQRGLEKLGDTRRVDVVSAESPLPELGEVVRYDSPTVSAWLMCTERETVSEGGVVTVRATLGEPTATLRQAIRRAI